MPTSSSLLDAALTDHAETLAALRQLDHRLLHWRHQGTIFDHPPAIVKTQPTTLGVPEFDVVIAGGTLGIILGVALVRQGWTVAILERGLLKGREQDWNISRSELSVLVELDLLTEVELNNAITLEFNPNRIQFLGGDPLWVRDILNLGVSPRMLLEHLKQTFLHRGGRLLEHHELIGVEIHPDGVSLTVKAAEVSHLTSRLLIDAMGHFSPLVAQARSGQSPEGLCMVVGTCATGLPHVNSGDLMVSRTPIQADCQYFWEAFPAQLGRTTYLFTYADLHPDRPSLEQLFTNYFQELPSYQNCALEEVSVLRALFGVFPSYRQSPLQFAWPRLLAVGDSSGQQSPLSFGGFGAMLRHLPRLSEGIREALRADALDVADLALLQPYQPNLSATWMFQRAMSPQVNQSLDPQQINHLLNEVFRTMTQLGDSVLDPFLQDTVQFKGLTQTLAWMTVQSPQLIPKILTQVGVKSLAQWLPHYAQLGLYTGLSAFVPVVRSWSDRLPPLAQYQWRRRLEAWQYGAGFD